jgi:putative ATP-binding cassette transporter
MKTQKLRRLESAQHLDRAVEPLEQYDENSNRLRRRLLLRRFWKGALGFWRTGGDRLCWVLPGMILLTVFSSLAASYGMNLWNRAIFDALERRDPATVLFWSIVYFPLLVASVYFVVTQVYARMTMQRRWRAWLNNHLLDRWLTNGRYYQLNLVGGDHKNPEYRIAEDIRVATDAPVDFATGIATAVLSAVTFIIVLWTIGGALSFHLDGITITIPGFLVIAAVIYAVFASGAMAFIGRRFVTVSENKNQSEAEYRYVLTRLSENGESIAVLGGEKEERNAVVCSLTTVSAPLARNLCSDDADDDRLPDQRLRCAGTADHPVRAEISRWFDVARRGHAGGFSLHHRAVGVQLAGRQLSAACRLDRIGAPCVFTHGLPRCLGAGGEGRRPD